MNRVAAAGACPSQMTGLHRNGHITACRRRGSGDSWQFRGDSARARDADAARCRVCGEPVPVREEKIFYAECYVSGQRRNNLRRLFVFESVGEIGEAIEPFADRQEELHARG